MTKKILLSQSCREFPDDHQFNGIDLFKLIGAFLICMIHIPIFTADALENGTVGYLNDALRQCLCRLAVPFYFTAAGFLLFRKTEFDPLDTDRIRGYCFKILRLLGTWTILLFFASSSIQLWYLGALVIAVVMLSVLLKLRVPMRAIVIIALVLFAIGLLGEPYYGFIEPLKNVGVTKAVISGYEALFTTTRNGVFFGFIFVLLGALFARKKIVMNGKAAVIGFIASLALLFAEVFLLKQYSHPKGFDMAASLLPAVFFLFYIATHLNLKNSPIYGRMRAIGMLIFYLHLLVNTVVGYALRFAQVKTGIDLSAFQFIISICVTTALAVIIERLAGKEKFKWLKYLYS